MRNERFEGRLTYTEAFAWVSEFYTDKSKFAASSDNFNSGQGLLSHLGIVKGLLNTFYHVGKLIADIVHFPKQVVIVLAHTIKHLAAFSYVSIRVDLCTPSTIIHIT